MQTSFWTKIELPIKRVDKDFPFAFDLYRTRYDGIVFLVTGLLVPLFALVLLRFIGGMGVRKIDDPVNTWLTLGYLVVNLVCCFVGTYYFYQKDSQLFIKSGLFIFYGFQILPLLLVFIFSPIGGLITKNKEVTSLFTIWLQILAEIIVIVCAFIWTIDLKGRFISTFKTSWKQLLVVVVVGAVLIWSIIFLYGIIFKNTILANDSKNQESLAKLLESENLAIKISASISLVILTVLIAPLAEELSARQAWFIGSANRTLGWITSALFFGVLHIDSGDFEHILAYFLGGLILATIFNISRGNVIYSWLAHLGYNGLTLTILLVKKLA